jgi:hypothetical protein
MKIKERRGFFLIIKVTQVVTYKNKSKYNVSPGVVKLLSVHFNNPAFWR